MLFSNLRQLGRDGINGLSPGNSFPFPVPPLANAFQRMAKPVRVVDPVVGQQPLCAGPLKARFRETCRYEFLDHSLLHVGGKPTVITRMQRTYCSDYGPIWLL